jgi:phosphoribosylaminoimidazole-succinocarboxamide synthase
VSSAVYETDCKELNLIKRGKVRDLYDLGDALLMVATDRISAFDVVMPEPIPDKGKVLTQISLFWFEKMAGRVKNHLITGNAAEFPPACRPYADMLEGRSMLVEKTDPLPIECVVRGYISGSGWKSYGQDGTVCGIPLPDGLVESDRLPDPLFTPSTKEEAGAHDINIDFEEAARRIGRPLAERVRELSLDIYRHGSALAREKGIIIADTKFEFGLKDGELLLIDEVLTPDSSRYWDADQWRPGKQPTGFDKQYLRDWLDTLDWDKTPPGPELPGHIVSKTRELYLELMERLTGRTP